MSQWEDNFTNRCLTCAYAISSKYKHQMTCQYKKAVTRGLPSAGAGGGTYLAQVHKLFGCIYWKKFS